MGKPCALPTTDKNCDTSLDPFNSCHTHVLPPFNFEPSVDTNDVHVIGFNNSNFSDECCSPHCDIDVHDIDSFCNAYFDTDSPWLPNFLSTHVSHAMPSHEQLNCVQMCADAPPYFQPPNHSNVCIQRLNPFVIRHERIRDWPHIEGVGAQTQKIYQLVRDTGLPNSLSACVSLSSALKLDNWDALATGHPYDKWIRQMLEFGFPLQFTGPLPKPAPVDNHASALKYPDHIERFIQKELTEQAMLGPYERHPFPTSHHVNPLMTRPKTDPAQRRIIVDLSYPEGQGPNSFVLKNHVFGTYVHHHLPTIEQALAKARDMDMNVSLAVIDIERAYRNLRIDPIDWPLSVVTFQRQFYLDVALPFGARLSSLYVQKIAEFISRALSARNITSLIYLDDLFLLLSDTDNTQQQFNEAMHVLRSLGLPINYSKLIPPAKQASWLGVSFDIAHNHISIPPHKVQSLLQTIRGVLDQSSIAYTEAQSLVGRIAHIARVVRPARLFMARVLNQMRDSDRLTVYIGPAVRADLQWFLTFFRHHNATAIIPNTRTDITIEADSSLASGGAWADRATYYIFPYTPRMAAAFNICHLEAINYLIAIRAFTRDASPGSRVELIGDNEGAINGISSGRAADAVLASVARALWFHAASRQFHIAFTHRAGKDIPGADILSRSALSRADRLRARQFVKDNALRSVKVHPADANFQKYH